ncbi:MAG: hypothetical protein WDN27_01780 [Candidatus Saccharibacteria bacterium]
MNKRNMVLTLILVILAVIALALPSMLTGGKRVTLHKASPLMGAISQSLGSDVKFTIASTQYFDNNSWALASLNISGLGNQTSRVVLQKRDGMFMVVLGPGSDFPTNALRSLPPDLAGYLSGEGT